ncbi:enolase [Holotrichia oblita]|nr:enolase [Holotrichia oblita]
MEMLDSRGNPTVMCEVWTDKAYGKAIVPSGASTGEYEAVELRDGDKTRYMGKGVLKAVANVNNVIAPKLVNTFDVTEQKAIDNTMIALDGTENKGKLGANAILAVSLAVAHAAANELNTPLYEYIGNLYKQIGGKTTASLLPMPMMNVINGGAHTNWESTDVQEFMIMPISAKTAAEAVRMGSEVFHNLKSILKTKCYSTSVGDEGGFAPKLKTNKEALELLMQTFVKAGYKPGKDFVICLDAAASEFYDNAHKNSTAESKYRIEGKRLTTTQIIDIYAGWVKDFPIASLEDMLDQNDWPGYVELTKRLGKTTQIMGDDFFVTNTKRLAEGIERKACNSILIKVNQIGSLSETLECIKMAHEAKFTTIISHRSGETEDTTIVDLAVAVNAGQLKTGSMSRSERVAKYNRLMYIEAELGKKTTFKNPFKN